MRQKVMLLTLIFSFGALGSDVKKVLPLLSKKIEPTPACEMPSRSFQSCMESICGESSKVRTYQDEINDLDKGISSVDSSDIERRKGLILDYYGKKVAATKKHLDDLKNLLEKNDTQIPQQLENLYKLIFVFGLLSNLDMENLIESAENQGNRLIMGLNQEKLRAELEKKYGKEVAKVWIGPFNEVINSEFIQKLFFANEGGWDLTIQGDFPGIGVKDIVQKMLSESEKNKEEIKSKSPDAYELLFSSSFINQKNIDQLAHEEHPSQKLLNSFFGSVYALNYFKTVILNGSPELNKIKLSDLKQLYSPQAAMAKIEETKKLLEKVNVAARATQNGSHCEVIHKKILAGLPSEKERESFQDKAQTIRNKFQERIMGRLSSESAKKVSEKFNDIMFDLPSSKEESSRLLQTSLEELSSDLKSEDELYEKKKALSEEKNLLFLGMTDFLNFSEDKYFNEVSDACDEFELDGLNDAQYDFGTGKIKVSWISIKNPAGEGVMAHELGHALSTIIRSIPLSEHSADSFKNARLCLSKDFAGAPTSIETISKHYSKYNTSINIPYTVNQYVEEDWADLIGAKYLQKEDPNFACLLLEKKNGILASNELTPKDNSDTHAPDLFRLLRIEYIKNKSLPVACLEQLTGDERTTLTRDCFE